MFKNFLPESYKSRNVAIIIGTAVLLVISYFLAFSKTIQLRGENKDLLERENQLNSAPEEIGFYSEKLNSMNEDLGYVGSLNTLSQEKILNFISQYTDTSEVFLASMPKTIIDDKNGYQLETNVIELQGAFKDIVSLIYQIEKTHGISKVVSSEISLQQDIYTKKKTLTTILYLQNIVI